MAAYEGPVVFREGVHYPVISGGEDAEDVIDLTRPLRWEAGAYRDAEEGEPLHNDVYSSGEIELPVGAE